MAPSDYNTENMKNYDIFRECVAGVIVHKSARTLPPTKPKRKGPKTGRSKKTIQCDFAPRNDSEELADFIDYIAEEIFSSLPEETRSLSYAMSQKDSTLADKYADPIPHGTFESLVVAVPISVSESLQVYGLLPDYSGFSGFLKPIILDYVPSAIAKPPSVDPDITACEICDRDWIPLTDHHLIPRGIHAKALKRGWHEEWELNNIARICRACHSQVHRIATNEELARHWYTVEKLLEREDVRQWAKWVLNTDTFDIYWTGQRYNYGLEKKAVARLRADKSLIDELKSPYPIDAPETDSDESDVEAPTSPNSLLRSSESPPATPPHTSETVDNSSTPDDADDNSDDEPLMARRGRDSPQKPVVPTNPEMPWKDPATNPFARLPRVPDGISRPPPIPIAEARSGRPMTNSRQIPSHDMHGSDSDTAHESDVDADGDPDSYGIPIDPLLTGKPYAPAKPQPPASKPPRKPAIKRKRENQAEGTPKNKRKRNVHFDLPNDEDTGANEDPVASEYPTPSPVKRPAKKPRGTGSSRGVGSSRGSASAAAKADDTPAPRGGSKARGTGKGRGSRGGAKARGGSRPKTGGKSI
ncbi:hypothetical protein FQN54_009446 [Arachnomyces sp. PD_36]|nr:hypothetical protein FQN54_009446 [Arachnomyces sp. PD_36]